MRTAFIRALLDAAALDERIWLLTADLGYSVLEAFAGRFPDRYINVGVAEQNLTGVAAGLAMTGKVVFTYSIANFPVMRCLEQIRNDVCCHDLRVRIVAVGGGVAYGAQGYTHHGLEDLAVMRAMPGMAVIAPGDPVETRLAVRALSDWPHPAYLRLGKAGEPVVHRSDPDFAIGKAVEVGQGSDATIVSTGGVLALAVQAAGELGRRGISTGVLSMHTVKPMDSDAILSAARQSRRILTVEEHGIGGLGSAVAEVLAASGRAARFASLTMGAEPVKVAGTQNWLRAREGLSVEGIVAAITGMG